MNAAVQIKFYDVMAQVGRNNYFARVDFALSIGLDLVQGHATEAD